MCTFKYTWFDLISCECIVLKKKTVSAIFCLPYWIKDGSYGRLSALVWSKINFQRNGHLYIVKLEIQCWFRTTQGILKCIRKSFNPETEPNVMLATLKIRTWILLLKNQRQTSEFFSIWCLPLGEVTAKFQIAFSYSSLLKKFF